MIHGSSCIHILTSALLVHAVSGLKCSNFFPSASRPVVVYERPTIGTAACHDASLCGSRGLNGRTHLYSGYIPPELDPEYRKIAVRSRPVASPSSIVAVSNETSESTTTADDNDSSLPAPKEGDIVLYKGRWGDKQIGRIRFMRYIESYQSFFADIVPLAEGKSEHVFVVDRASQAEYLSTDELQPVKAYFMRSENGYKLYYSKASPKEVVLRAPKYRKMDPSYTPRSKVINYDLLDDDLKDYEQLKYRISAATLQIGGLIAVGLAVGFNLDTAGSYYVGVLGSVLYFYLLGKKVENIGSKYSALPNRPVVGSVGVDEEQSSPTTTGSFDVVQFASKRLSDNVSALRLAVPLLMLGLLTTKGYLVDGSSPRLFRLIPQSEYIATMAGFLTLRIALYFKEVGKEFRAEDLIGIVPGSLAITLRQLLSNKKTDDAAVDAPAVVDNRPQQVLFVTGPAAAGRATLLSSVLRGLPGAGAEDHYRVFKLLTTDERFALQGSDWYQYVTVDELNKLRLTQDIVCEGLERDPSGQLISVAVSARSLLLADRGVTRLMVGPPSLLESLNGYSGIDATAVWVSMQSKEQFVRQAAAMVARGEGNAGTTAELVDVMVEEAARDISYYTRNAALFDYTVLAIATQPGAADDDGDAVKGGPADELREIIRLSSKKR